MKLIFFLITIVFFKPVFSQEKDTVAFDPKIKYTQTIVDTLFTDLKKGNKKVKNIEDLKKILETNNTLLGWPYYYYKKVRLYQEVNYDSVIFYADKGIKSYENSKVKRDFDEQDLLQLNYQKAYALSMLNKHKEAIINYQKALDFNKKYPYKWKSFIVSGIARSHHEMGNESLALNSFLELIKDSLYMNMPRPAIVTYSQIGVVYCTSKDFEKSKYYYKKALDRSNNSSYKAEIASIFNGLGVVFYNEKNMDSTTYYYKKAIKANAKYGIGNYYGAIENDEFCRAYVNIFEGDLKNGIIDLQKLKTKLSLAETKTKEDKELMFRVINALGLGYQKQENYREYQNLLTETFVFLNAFHQGQLEEDLQNLEIKYQTKEKDASILQLEKSKQQQDTIIKQQKTITYGLGGFLLVLSGFGYLFWRQRKLRNQYEKENLKQRLLLSQMNPHFIGNAMNTISAMVEKKSENTISYINKLSNLFRLVLNNSREEFVSLEDEIITIKSYLELQSNFSKDFDFRVSIDKEVDEEEVIIPPMLIQPFIENAIIHGLSNTEIRGQIDVVISKQDDNKGLLLCKISDNGVGYSKSNDTVVSKKHISISGDIIKERLIVLKKKFKVNSRVLVKEIEKGTTVELYLPFLIDI